MPANVDSMMYHGEVPWHGLGTQVAEAPTSTDALIAAGLDWDVSSEPIYTFGERQIEGYRVNLRSDNDAVLGVVSDRYRVVQNDEAFAWIDDLMGHGMRFETAGALKEGQRVWMTAKLPDEYKIAGDPVTTYLTFTNGHDGRHAVQVMVSPVRVVCQNTLNYSIMSAPRMWSAVHSSNVHGRIDEARRALSLTDGYMTALADTAEQWANVTLAPSEWHDMVEYLVPAERVTQRVQGLRTALETAMFRPDQKEFFMTGWGAANAVSWMTSHQQFPKNPERAMANFLDGDRIQQRLADALNKEVVA